MQEKYRLNIWFVFSNEKNHFNIWYWIPVLKVKENGKKYSNYFAVPMEDFIIASKNQGIEKLFSEMMKFV